MMKRALALLLVFVLMLGCLAGCGGNEDDTAKTPEGTSGGTSNGTSEEMPTVRMFYECAPVEDLELVEAALSKLTEEKIGCKLDLITVPFASYGEQANLITSSSSDPVDIIMMEGWVGVTAPVMASKGALMPLDELVEKYGQGAKEALGDYINAGIFDGKLYQLCSIKNLAVQQGVLMRKDLVEKYNIDVESITCEADLTAVFEIVSAGEPDMIMTGPEGVGLWVPESEIDPLGDKLGILDNRGESLEVVDLADTELFEKCSRLHAEWYNRGWIAQDILTSPDSCWDLIHAGKQFSVVAGYKPGIEAEKFAASQGVELIAIPLNDAFTFTSRVSTYGWSIPYNAPNPEKAMQVLNLMFTDPEFMNLIDWGIEGVHYKKVEGYDNVITFADGVTAETSGYYHGYNYAYGNQLITYVWEGSDPDLYKQLDAWNRSADTSKALGFVWDYTAVKTEYTAVNNVNEKYQVPISMGIMDYDTYIEEYKAELEKAGIDVIIAEKQRQLDAWAEANGVQ